MWIKIVQRINAIHVNMAIFYREIHVRNVQLQYQTVRNVKNNIANLVMQVIFYIMVNAILVKQVILYRIIHARNVDKTVLIVQRINAIHVKMAIFYREIHVRNVQLQYQTVRNVKNKYAILVKQVILYRIIHARNVDKNCSKDKCYSLSGNSCQKCAIAIPNCEKC